MLRDSYEINLEDVTLKEAGASAPASLVLR